MPCNQNCQQGRTCNCPAIFDTDSTPTWWAALIWGLTMGACTTILWALVNVAHAKTITYEKRVKCLAEAVYREARGETYRGQLAVAQTVINRVKSSRFPNDLCKVVFQRGQFSWTQGWSGDWRADRDSYQVARVALMGTHSLKDFKALYFHNSTVNPGWNKKKLARIGNHIFYV
jgi:spore germination cell wall hydrolase CwlJ-like protein